MVEFSIEISQQHQLEDSYKQFYSWLLLARAINIQSFDGAR